MSTCGMQKPVQQQTHLPRNRQIRPGKQMTGCASEAGRRAGVSSMGCYPPTAPSRLVGRRGGLLQPGTRCHWPFSLGHLWDLTAPADLTAPSPP